MYNDRATYPLDSIPFLLRNRDGLGTGRQGHVVINILTEDAEELVGVLGNELSQSGVASAELLQDGLQHLRLLLDNLAQLLELGVVSKEVQVAELAGLTCGTRTSCYCGGSRRSLCPSARSTTSLLSSEIEQVDTRLVVTCGRSTTGGRSSSRRSRGSLSRSLWWVDVLGDALRPSALRSPRIVSEGRAHIQ